MSSVESISRTSVAAAASAPITVRKVGAFLGAEVTGIDLTRPLDTQTVEAVRQAHAVHEVLIFPGQKISAEDLKRFGRCFGELSVHPFGHNDEDSPELIIFDHNEKNPPRGTDVWHSDETFRECPPMGTMLCSKISPAIGGDTVFCSMTAAYESLSDKMQQFLSGLEAVHDFLPFKKHFQETAEGRRKLHEYEELYRPVTHPVVRVHPITGKKSIYVNQNFTVCIKGLEENESLALLDKLYRLTSVLEHQYRHRWVPDTLVFWDNRSVKHAAVHDYYPQRRVMERVTIAGDRPMGTGETATGTALRKFKAPVLPPSGRNRQHERT